MKLWEEYINSKNVNINSNNNSANVVVQAPKEANNFFCKRCKTHLFSIDQLIDDDVHQVTDSCESYFFSEPLAWMSSVEGKHNCPKCDAKICTLRWSGFKCSCGAWVAPGIQIPYSRVDGKYM